MAVRDKLTADSATASSPRPPAAMDIGFFCRGQDLVGRTFASLKYRNYAIWFAASLVANTGGWMQRTAQNWLVMSDLTNNDAFAVGIVTALQFVPIPFIMPLAGALADRLDKRKMVVLTQFGMLLTAVALGVLVLLGWANVLVVCLFALAIGVIQSFDNPPRLVFISELVPPRWLPNAVGLNSMSFNIARLIGPALGGLLIGLIGTGWVFIINGIMFGATLIALALMRPEEFHPAPRPEKKVSAIQGTIDGLRYVGNRSDLLVIFAVVGVVSCLAMNTPLTTVSMSTMEFHADSTQFGIVSSMVAVGSLSGAVVGARRTKQPRVRSVVGAGVAMGIAVTANALAPNLLVYTLTLVPVGFFMLIMLTAANAAVQMSTSPQMRGRVVSLYQTVNQGVTPIGSLVVGGISGAAGARWGVGIGAIGCLVATVGAYLWGRRKWDVEVHYRVRHPFQLEILGPLEHENEEREAELRANRTGQTDSGQSFTAEDHDEVEADLFEPEDEAHDVETGHSPQRAGGLEWQDTHEEPDVDGRPGAAPAAETKETRDE
ncbi:MFS transporter [Actinotignum schaalii]|uniref:MFS transporter n=1 Tax=Schaalia turicensis TaxID=131111 RepID=A0ABZ0RHN4_9ACTO|nr:MFS transporter [Actinotignum sanguinis]WPJ88451.1 MFS transporter [Schaalia turicensis]MDK8287036.1 MFS transporter [Actinotignum sanguinis]MDK8650943.1 MFS transporter [Actinotignum sanguinis]MDK8800792.1 MFS transporter [Actinotignum sanguinis]MDV2437816.1 MFS transporter [Actinotignum sanguinis]